MKIQIPSPPIARTIWLGVLTLTLVVVAADGRVVSSARDEAHGNRWAWSRSQQPPQAARPDSQRPPSQPRVPWWKDAAVIKEISLTPEQAARIDAVWRKRETEMHGVAVEARKQQDELNRLVAERKVGVDVIGLQFDRNEALRSMLAKSRAIALYQTSLILTTEQNKALKAIGERNRRERR